MKHLSLYETFPSVTSEPQYADSVFKIRYRSTNDLSNKKGNDTIDKPVDDVLDGFEPGDLVRGEGLDGEFYEGKIIRIKRDADGDGSEVFIEADGEQVQLRPSSLSMVGEVGNNRPTPEVAHDEEQMDTTRGETFQPTTYESASQLKHLKKFGEI